MTRLAKLRGRRTRVEGLRSKLLPAADTDPNTNVGRAVAALNGYLAALSWVEGGTAAIAADRWLDDLERVGLAGIAEEVPS